MKKSLTALAVLAAIVLSGTASANRALRADSPTFVINRQIGDMRMGESESRLAYEYGSDCLAGCPGIQDGSLPGIAIFRYKLHGRFVRVGYHKERVVYLETNAPYYRTGHGLGVGTVIPFGKRYGVFHWHRCNASTGYWITDGPLATQLSTSGGRVTVVVIWGAYVTMQVGRQGC